MSRRAQIFAAAALLALSVAAPTAHAAKSKKFASEVEVAGLSFDPSVGAFVGDVHSKRPKCERNREVSLYVTPSGGDRELVGTDITDRTGDWEVEISMFTQDDSFDATVARRKYKRPGKDIVCKADESPPLIFDPVV